MEAPPPYSAPGLHQNPPAVVRQTDIVPTDIRLRPEQQVEEMRVPSYEDVHRALGRWIAEQRKELGWSCVADSFPTIMQTRMQLQQAMEKCSQGHWGERSKYAAIALLSPWLPQQLVDRMADPYGVDEPSLTRKEKRALAQEEGDTASGAPEKKKGWY